MDHLFWHLTTFGSSTGLMPMVRAALVCGLLYQIDIFIVLGAWLLRKIGIFPDQVTLEPHNRKDAILVMPTLLRKPSELEGLKAAMHSVATNRYPGRLYVVACIDGVRESQALYTQLQEWAAREPVPDGVEFHVAGPRERRGKAVAMHAGIEHMQALIACGKANVFPELFFNMDADSTLGEGALERMVYRLTRKRLLRGTPYHIVTSNVVVPLEQCWAGPRSLLSRKHWLALLVAREYLSSITIGKYNWKIFPRSEVSGALYCTWSEAHLAAPLYARFMQTLTFKDWLKWWLGFPPPKFSEYRGEPLPEAMTGPGDDTWMGWLASTATWKNGHLCLDAPRTPVHALGRFILGYFSRSLNYDPLIKVYSKTPTTAKALFKQRLRWNSSRVQDLKRWAKSHLYHWNMGIPLVLSSGVVIISIGLFAATLLAPLYLSFLPAATVPFAVLTALGYSVTRVTSTVAALLISDSPRSEWIKLIALPFSGVYHVAFNTVTLLIGYSRDTFGFGEPTTFAPEETLRDSNLSRIALAYRLRRASLLAVRAAVRGDVPFGAFWFGWKHTPWTPSGFDGWTTGKKAPAIYWHPPPVPMEAIAPEQEVAQPEFLEQGHAQAG